MPNKIEVARMISESFPGLPSWLGMVLWWLGAALGSWRFTSVIRSGATWIDLFVVPLGLALLVDLVLQRWLFDQVTWMGAGIGLVAGAVLTRNHPWIVSR